MTRVNAQIKDMRLLRERIRTAAADGKITQAERKSVAAVANKLDRVADKMLVGQARPVEAAALAAKKALAGDRMVRGAMALAASITKSITDLRTIDAAMRKRDPLKSLPGKWHPAYQGVSTRTIVRPGLKVHLVAIDLLKAELQTNSHAARGRTVNAQAQKHGAEVAVNGDFFSYGTYKPSGLAMTDGKAWPKTENWESFIGFNGGRAQVFHDGAKPPGWVANAVSSRPTVLAGGKVVTAYAPHVHTGREPRTGVGLSKDRRVMFMAVVEGRSKASRGMTPAELGKLLKRYGAHDAISMDAGGSSTLYVRGKGVVNRPSDGQPRAVANVLMVQARKR